MDNVVAIADRQGGDSLPIDTTQVVRWMKELREAREELEENTERGKEYLRQCKEEVYDDLDLQQQHVEKLEQMLTIFINEEHGGAKYKVPGIGTVFTTKRRTPKIIDEEQLIESIEARNPLKLITMTSTKLDRAKAQKYANEHMKETGEVLPGIEITETESLSLRQ